VTNRLAQVTVSGATRTYLLTTPAPHRQAAPLVLDFHGYGEGDYTESRTTQLGALGQRDGFITAFPEGSGTPVAWDVSTQAGNRDLGFVGALLDHLEATQCIDMSRVYATGLSQGGFMTSTLACAMSARFAAFAPVDGVRMPMPCHPARPVPILTFHGTADPILKFNGGIDLRVIEHDLQAQPGPLPKLPPTHVNGAGIPATVRAWAAKDGCNPTPTDTRVSPHVIHRVYQCPTGAALEFYIVVGGGHTWPGSALDAQLVRFVGPTTRELNASQTIWAFFQRFRLTRRAV